MNILIIFTIVAILVLTLFLYFALRAWLSAHLAIQALALQNKEIERELASQRNAIYRRTGNYDSKKKPKEEKESEIPFNQEFADSLPPDERQQYIDLIKGKYKNEED